MYTRAALAWRSLISHCSYASRGISVMWACSRQPDRRLIAWQCMQREQAERARAAAEVLAAQHQATVLRAKLQQHAASPGSLHALPSLQVGP